MRKQRRDVRKIERERERERERRKARRRRGTYGSVALDGRTISEMPWKILKVPRQYASHLSRVHFISSFYSIFIFCPPNVGGLARDVTTPRGDTTRLLTHSTTPADRSTYSIRISLNAVCPNSNPLLSLFDFLLQRINEHLRRETYRSGNDRWRGKRKKPGFSSRGSEKRTERSYRKGGKKKRKKKGIDR